MKRDANALYCVFLRVQREMCIRDRLKATAGSAANLRLLTGEYLQLAIAQADLVQDAYDQTGIFADEEESRGFGAVAALYTETCQVAVSYTHLKAIKRVRARNILRARALF